jgi:HSP20 family molecular chaperone IbpA
VWSPRIEAFQRGDEFIVRAELPGLKRKPRSGNDVLEVELQAGRSVGINEG